MPFPEVKRPGRGADHPVLSSPRLECGLSYTSVFRLYTCLARNETAIFIAYTVIPRLTSDHANEFFG